MSLFFQTKYEKKRDKEGILIPYNFRIQRKKNPKSYEK